MNLKLKTNRNSIIAWWIPLFIIGIGALVYLLIDCYYLGNKSAVSDELSIMLGVLLGIFLLGLILYKYLGRRLHLISNETIQVFEGKKRVYYINVEDITQIKYIKCNIEYILKRIEGGPRSGEACKLYISLKQGNIITLGCFSTKDAKKIKKLYGDLATII